MLDTMLNLQFDKNLYDLWKRRSEWLVHTQRMRVSGLQHVPMTGGAVLAANHINWKDIFLIAGTVPRVVSFIGTAELLDIAVCKSMIERYMREHLPMSRFLGIASHVSSWAARTVAPRVCKSGTIPVKRNDHDKSFFELAKEALRQHRMLVIFPEGHTSKPDRIKRFRLGLAKVVYDLYKEEDNSIPVIPAAIRGTERFFFPGRSLSVRLDRPFFIEDFPAAQEKQILLEFSEKLRWKIQDMLHRSAR